jgi:hypothetical protein
VGIGQGMVVLAGSAIVLWLALAVMVRTGLARPGSLPWPLPGFLQEAGWQPGARSAAGALKQWQRAGFWLLSSILGPGANREARAHPGEIAFFRPVVDFQPTGQGAELRPYRPDTALVEDLSLPTEGPLSLAMGPAALVDAINDWLGDPANRSKQLP